MKKYVIILFILISILLNNKKNIYSQKHSLKEKTFRFTYGIKIIRKEKEFINFRIYIPLPSEKYGQKLIINNKNIIPDQIIENKNKGLKYLYYNIGEKINKNNEVILSIDVNITKNEKNINFLSSPVNPDLCNKDCQKEYLKSDNYINIDNKFIQNIANNLKTYSVIKRAYKAFNFVRGKLKIKRRFKGLIPLDIILKQGDGECSDFATLFVAIMRAAKVPARHVIGRIMTEDETKSYHVWAEFYDKNYGWIPVDPYYYKWRGKLLFGYEPVEYVVIHKGINISKEIKRFIPFLQTYYYFYSSKYGKIDFNLYYIWHLKKK